MPRGNSRLLLGCAWRCYSRAPMSLAELRAAVDAELAATPAYYDFKVLHREADGALWRVRLEPGYVYAEGQRPGAASAQALLDDSLDGASAWWGVAPGEMGTMARGGGASVLAVRPEDDEMVLQNSSSPPPAPGLLIRLYPPRFLQPRWPSTRRCRRAGATRCALPCSAWARASTPPAIAAANTCCPPTTPASLPALRGPRRRGPRTRHASAESLGRPRGSLARRAARRFAEGAAPLPAGRDDDHPRHLHTEDPARAGS